MGQPVSRRVKARELLHGQCGRPRSSTVEVVVYLVW